MFLDNTGNDKRRDRDVQRRKEKYSKEFKLSAVYLMLSNTMQPKEIFKMLDVDRQAVYRWVSEFKALEKQHSTRRYNNFDKKAHE